MNWKGCERKRPWPKFKHFAGISLEGPNKSHLRPVTISDLQFWAQDIPKKKKETLKNTKKKNTTLTYKGKFYLLQAITDQGRSIYIYSFCKLGSKRVGWSKPITGRWTPEEETGTHCIKGWVDSVAGMDGC